ISRFVQAIANDGVMLPPTLEMSRAADPPRGEQVMSAATAQRLRDAMLRVTERGTGRRASALLRAKGWRLGAKTGTAEVAGRRDNGWFAAILFSPDGEPRYTIVSFLEGGGPGGAMPGTIAASVAQVLAEDPPTAAGTE